MVPGCDLLQWGFTEVGNVLYCDVDLGGGGERRVVIVVVLEKRDTYVDVTLVEETTF